MLFTKRLVSLKKELESHPLVILKKFNIRSPQAFDLGIYSKIDPTIINFYTEMDGFEIEWDLKDSYEDRDSYGNIQIAPAGTVFTKPSEYIDPRYLGFDYFIAEANCGLWFDPKNDSNPIYFKDGDDNYCPIASNFNEYFELLIKSRGFWYWQMTKATPKLFPEITSPEEQEFFQKMPLLFADFDPSDFNKFNS
ncbi:SMI1/KNR4 family protein [Aquimarina agarivorans]|uniref:SMI1/KNR4 family protein n=1 Tax=Aquimarina agarivorans TaxID=980584 RepID=UPI000248E5ED|nr:SMI1/KNR4 family protein [Aquimarina agarivorans]